LSVRFDAIVPAGFSAGATRVAGQRLRKRGGLSVRGATGLLQLPLQAVIVAPQPIALPFDAFEFAAQAILFALRTLGAFTQVVGRGRLLVICACGPLPARVSYGRTPKIVQVQLFGSCKE
jgi:hypothetical protein